MKIFLNTLYKVLNLSKYPYFLLCCCHLKLSLSDTVLKLILLGNICLEENLIRSVNKLLTNEIQQCMKTDIMTGLSQVCKDGSALENQSM